MIALLSLFMFDFIFTKPYHGTPNNSNSLDLVILEHWY